MFVKAQMELIPTQKQIVQVLQKESAMQVTQHQEEDGNHF